MIPCESIAVEHFENGFAAMDAVAVHGIRLAARARPVRH
jgi:hypothetical protein